MNQYLLAKALHIIAMTAWMAGLFYLPRLFVYHHSAVVGSDMDRTFQQMESRLLRIITTPAMIITFGLGLWLIDILGREALAYWLYAKLCLVMLLAAFHGYLAVMRKEFAQGKRPHSPRFFRIINEFPTLILCAIVLLVVFKPG